MKKFAAAAGLAVALMGGSAAMAADVEVLHWWTAGGEQAAVQVFAKEFEARTTNKWIDTAVALGQTARETIMQRALGGDPPDAAQFNPGRQYEELIAAGLLLDLTPLAEKEKWAELVRPDETRAPCFVDGHWWCVPVNIHSPHWVWASNAAFAGAGIPVPNTVQGFVDALPKLKASGVIPIAVGGDGGGWQINVMSDALLMSILGAEKRQALMKDLDATIAGGPEIKTWFETMRTFAQNSDEGSVNRNWNDTTALVLNNKAGFQFMGDWAHGEFSLAGKVAGKDYTCVIGPSPDPTMVLQGDIFLFFKQSDPAVEAAQFELASTMLNPEVQVAFNLAKGSLPVRSDVDLGAADECMKAGLPLLDAGKTAPAQTAWRTEAFTNSLNALVSEFWFNTNVSVDDAQKQFVDLIANAD